MKLFAIFIGGIVKGALIEQHDMRFVVAESIEQTYDALRASWWGDPQSLHLDAWGELQTADGYSVCLASQPSGQPEKLWFVYLGGYDLSQFTEIHRSVFLVANSELEAKSRAKAMVPELSQVHKDNQYDIDSILCLNDLVGQSAAYIHLKKSEVSAPFSFTCDYVAIGRKVT